MKLFSEASVCYRDINEILLPQKISFVMSNAAKNNFLFTIYDNPTEILKCKTYFEDPTNENRELVYSLYEELKNDQIFNPIIRVVAKKSIYNISKSALQ